MKKHRLLISLLLIFLCGSGIYWGMNMESTSNHMTEEWFLTHQLAEDKQWDIDTAQKIREQSYAFLGGVTDDEKFLLLLKQAFIGDKNALLQLAITRLEDNEVISRPDFYSEGSQSQVDMFIKKYQQQLVTDDDISLTEPSLLRKDPWAMITQMADSGHPASSLYYFYEKVVGNGSGWPLTDEKRNAGLGYLNNLLGVKRYQRFAHRKTGDFILFDDGESIYYGTTETPSRLKALSDRREGLTQAEESKAIEMYRVCAMQGELSCATHLTEAYADGIGVERNWLQAYAWARVVNFAHYPFLVEVTKKNDSHQMEVFSSMNQRALAVIKLADEQLTASEKLAGQKMANKLIDEISFS